jgi:hypothetical protein
VRGAATCIQRMQKALTQMNVQLANVLSDISGLTGQTIIRAIVAGERDPRKSPFGHLQQLHRSELEFPQQQCAVPVRVASSSTWSMPAHARFSESLGIPTFWAIWSAVAKPIP